MLWQHLQTLTVQAWRQFFVLFGPPYWISDLLPVICIVFEQPIKTAPRTDLSRVVPFSSPEAALLLVSTKNRDLWPSTSGQVQHRKSANHGLPVTLRMFRIKFDKSDWFWSQCIVLTKPFKNGMPLDQARGSTAVK